MGIKSEMIRQGNWLFRRRSFVPIAFLIPLSYGVATMRWPFGSYAVHEVVEFIALAVSFLGVFIRVVTVGHTPVGTSGRNTHDQVAEQLNTTGIYATVRHPLYLGNFLIGAGVVLVPMELWLVAVYCLAFWLYYERIMAAEEAFLRGKFGSTFDDWAKRTPAFLPNPRLWVRPALPFSLRNVLKREYTAFALVVVCHAMIETLEHLFIDRAIKFEIVWEVMSGTTIVAYFILRALKRHTNLLCVEGR